MHLLSAIASIACVLQLAAAAKPFQARCGSDSCIKAVRSNRKSGGHPGCMAFLRTTLIPPASTSTTTRTTTVPPPIGKRQRLVNRYTLPMSILPRTIPANANVKRTTTTTSQTNVPTYASAVCSNTVQYSSACNCVKIPHQTTTLQTPTTTKESVVTQTAFWLSGVDRSEDTSVDGYYVTYVAGGTFRWVRGTTDATFFTVDQSDGSLRLAENPSSIFIYADPEASLVMTGDSVPAGFRAVVCAPPNAGLYLKCRPQGTETNSETYYFQATDSSSNLGLGASPVEDGYGNINLFVEGRF